MHKSEEKIWFPAMRQGWGWGLPITWQGWVVFIAYLGLVAAGVGALRAGAPLLAFLLYVFGLSSGFLAVCWLKGDKAEWR